MELAFQNQKPTAESRDPVVVPVTEVTALV
jgi:hypothetical protein